jgi:hypothetical protein
MYLLYLDDSGSAKNANEEYLVLGGASVFERRAHFIAEELETLAAQYDGSNPDSVEFHASEIFRGKTHPWSTLKSRQERIRAIKNVLKVLEDDHYGTFGHLPWRFTKSHFPTMILWRSRLRNSATVLTFSCKT